MISTHDVGRCLTGLMRERGMTVQQAADVAEIGRSTLQAWRSGAKPTDYAAVRRLAQALGATLSFLLTGEDDAPPDGPPTIAEVFNEDGVVLDGFCYVTIRKLTPRRR